MANKPCFGEFYFFIGIRKSKKKGGCYWGCCVIYKRFEWEEGEFGVPVPIMFGHFLFEGFLNCLVIYFNDPIETIVHYIYSSKWFHNKWKCHRMKADGVKVHKQQSILLLVSSIWESWDLAALAHLAPENIFTDLSASLLWHGLASLFWHIATLLLGHLPASLAWH